MIKKSALITCLISLLSFISFSQNSQLYQENEIIIKIKPSNKNICFSDKIQSIELNEYLSYIKTSKVLKKFPFIKSPSKEKNKSGNKLVDLSTIYQFKYDANIPIEKIIKTLNKLDIVEYAQAVYFDEILTETVNDPKNGDQYYLETIQAYDAWEIEKGDTSMIIGIVDTGFDIVHEDLVESIAYNYNDPIDGIDNDNDGFIDNFRGWDIGNNDNNPITEKLNHGTQVAGFAAATTNNGVGISGVGYNCKFLPVKIDNFYGTLTGGYEGIIYAAEHGCKIINCSWGSCYGHPYGQDIINYATYNKDALVIASAGNYNCGLTNVMYPAAYENVLAVAASGEDDIKWINDSGKGSTIGIEVDVTTPGANVLTTNTDNSYLNGWGTSYASPITAGVAGILRSHFPEYSALQIGEKIRVTTDYIDDLDGNSEFVGLMGTGRTNMYRALTDTNTPAVRFKDITIKPNSYNYSNGDTVYISGIYKNFLDSVTGLNTTLTTLSGGVEIIQQTNNIGTLKTLDTISNSSTPFSFIITSESIFDIAITLKILYEGENYSDFQYIEILINSSHLNIHPNNIQTTVCANGRMGYNTTSPLTGLGFLYKDLEPLYELGLIMGKSNDTVASSIYGYDHFTTTSKTKIIENDKVDSLYQSNFEIQLYDNFKDIKIQNNVLAWKDSPKDNFLILEYTIFNKSLNNVNDIYVSLFADWDLGILNIDNTAFDENLKMGYTYNVRSDSLYAGIAVLSDQNVNHYGIDNTDGEGEGIDVSDSFTLEEQFFTMTNNRHTSGSGDVMELTTAGPISIKSSDSTKVTFAVILADNLYELKNAANEANFSYNNYLALNNNEISISNNIKIYPVPTKSIINIETTGISELEYIIYNIKGQKVFESKKYILSKNSNFIQQDISKLDKGFYFIKLSSNLGKEFKKIIID